MAHEGVRNLWLGLFTLTGMCSSLSSDVLSRPFPLPPSRPVGFVLPWCLRVSTAAVTLYFLDSSGTNNEPLHHFKSSKSNGWVKRRGSPPGFAEGGPNAWKTEAEFTAQTFSCLAVSPLALQQTPPGTFQCFVAEHTSPHPVFFRHHERF